MSSGRAQAFEVGLIGGPWKRRLAPRRAWVDALPWDEALPRDVEAARLLWTRTAFSEYSAAAAFGELVRRMLAAGAPIDLVAAAGDFVVDEVVHTEVAARIAAALGGAVALEVDLGRLVRPAESADPLVAAAELAVRASCVGEALTVPMLKLSRELAGSALIASALEMIVADESPHAQLGWWFLDWADDRLDDAARAHLGRVAGQALAAFAPLLGAGCGASGLGMVACDRFDPMFVEAARRRVVEPLGERGIVVPGADLAALA
ncbi:MAG: hypothetical protein U1F43_02475 [Myxococcota bacterium]